MPGEFRYPQLKPHKLHKIPLVKLKDGEGEDKEKGGDQEVICELVWQNTLRGSMFQTSSQQDNVQHAPGWHEAIVYMAVAFTHQPDRSSHEKRQ